MKASDYKMFGDISLTGLTGFVGTLGAYVAYNTHDPVTTGTSAILVYITAESTNKLLGSEKLLCQKALGKIKYYLKKLHR